MTDTPTLTEQIRDAIKQTLARGWSLNRLAIEMEIPQPQLYRFVHQQSTPSAARLDHIAAFFGMRLTKPRIPAPPK